MKPATTGDVPAFTFCAKVKGFERSKFFVSNARLYFDQKQQQYLIDDAKKEIETAKVFIDAGLPEYAIVR